MVVSPAFQNLSQRHYNQLNKGSTHMTKSLDDPWLSSSLLRPIGYCLLLLTLFDLISILVPPRLMNPTWEFQTINMR